jgi:hypothetical protein
MPRLRVIELVSCACNSSAISGEGFEDLLGGLGPDERPWVLVPVGNPRADVGLQGLDTLVDSPAEQLVGQEPEPPFDLVDPRRTDRGEVQVNRGCRPSQALIAGVLWVP